MDRARRLRNEASPDAGFSLVEVVVALTVAVIGIVGVMSVTGGSFKVATAASTRSKAVAVATQEVEALRAVPYAELPVSATASTSTTMVDRSTYSVSRSVVWEKDTARAIDQAYKKVVVAVGWTDQTGFHEISQESLVYPGGVGPAATSTTSTTTNCIPAVPTALVATVPLDLSLSTNTVDLVWVNLNAAVCPAATYVIQYSTNNFATSNELTRTATAMTYRVTDLSPGTSYRFRVGTTGTNGAFSGWSSVASASTAASLQTTCAVGNVTVTPSAVKKQGNGSAGLQSNIAVSLSTSGSCPGYTVLWRPRSTVTSEIGMTVAPLSRTYTAQISGGGTWDIGKRYVDIVVTSTRTRVATVLLTVCAHNAAVCS